MNPPEFYGSRVEEDPQEFIDDIQKVMQIMGVSPIESADLAAYQFNGVAKVWYKQWKEDRGVDAGPVDWNKFVTAFLDRFFSLELSEANVQEFIKLKQGNMTAKEYSLKFTQLSKYVPSIVSDSRACISKFFQEFSRLWLRNVGLLC